MKSMNPGPGLAAPCLVVPTRKAPTEGGQFQVRQVAPKRSVSGASSIPHSQKLIVDVVATFGGGDFSASPRAKSPSTSSSGIVAGQIGTSSYSDTDMCSETADGPEAARMSRYEISSTQSASLQGASGRKHDCSNAKSEAEQNSRCEQRSHSCAC